MPTKEFQQALARILTDPTARTLFFNEEELFLSKYSLNLEELAQLGQLRKQYRKGLEFFATLGSKKRVAKVYTFLPLTFKALPKGIWNQGWLAYCQSCPMEAFLMPINDALNFAGFLTDFLTKKKITDKEIFIDLVLYEYNKLTIASLPTTSKPVNKLALHSNADELLNLFPLTQRHYTIQRLRFDFSKIIPYLKSNSHMPVYVQKTTFFIFYRNWKTETIDTAKVNQKLITILEMCDGRTDVRSIAGNFLPKIKSSQTVQLELTRTLISLEEQGLIVFMPNYRKEIEDVCDV